MKNIKVTNDVEVFASDNQPLMWIKWTPQWQGDERFFQNYSTNTSILSGF